MVVCLTVFGYICTALLEHGWMGRQRGQRASGIVTCGGNRMTLRIYSREKFSRSDAAPSTRGESLRSWAITQKDSRCSIDKRGPGTALQKSSHSLRAAVDTPQPEPGKTNNNHHPPPSPHSTLGCLFPSLQQCAGLTRHSPSHHWLSQQLLWIISGVRVNAPEDVSAGEERSIFSRQEVEGWAGCW